MYAGDVDPDAILFTVDTALSWDGSFPPVGAGDYLVILGHGPVLVSRRYVGAVDGRDAAAIAIDAFEERNEGSRPIPVKVYLITDDAPEDTYLMDVYLCADPDDSFTARMDRSTVYNS